MNEILNIIYALSKNDRLLDEDSIRMILDILIEEYSITNIDSFEISLKYPNIFKKKITAGYYSNINKSLVLYLNRIKMLYYKTDFIYENEIEGHIYYLKYNLHILRYLLHEIEHSIQYGLNDESLESKLIRLNISIGQKEYKKSYMISPMERLANMKAYFRILDILKYIKDEVESLFKVQELILLETGIYEYKNNESPTIKFLEKYDGLNLLDNFDINNLSFTQRFLFGLPLKIEEYNNIKKTIELKRSKDEEYIRFSI